MAANGVQDNSKTAIGHRLHGESLGRVRIQDRWDEGMGHIPASSAMGQVSDNGLVFIVWCGLGAVFYGRCEAAPVVFQQHNTQRIKPAPLLRVQFFMGVFSPPQDSVLDPRGDPIFTLESGSSHAPHSNDPRSRASSPHGRWAIGARHR